MEFVKDPARWFVILYALFFALVCVTAFTLYSLPESAILEVAAEPRLVLLYWEIGLILILGSLALWGVRHARAARQTPSPDVTEPIHTALESNKEIALAIQQQNKKITESMRYAKRIQSAILPNTRLIHRVLPDSFILYKPKEVVSGDFPWFAQVKNEVFMAAVDCTGHGVPGALLSLVGYFLLNDIVRSRRVTDPGRILDLLDDGVSTTLRPDEDAGTKDGMDISLCKIDLEQREVEYAGAHRPLYVVRAGVLEEIKGNKFPIGGGIFKNQTNFTTNRIKLGKGDSIYFFSDGFCDQFGGPEDKKFGTRQLREMILKVHTLPMKEAAAIFDQTWENWKGDQKQTDDVMLIGVKF